MSYELIQSIISGLLLGGAFAVLSVGFSLTWGITHVLNIAHSAFAVLAAYLGYWAARLWGIDPVLSLVVILPLFFVLGVLMHETLIKLAVQRTKDLTLTSMVLTFGLAMIMENLMLAAWSPDPRVVKTAYTGQAFHIGEFALPYTRLVSFGLAVVTLGALYVFMNRTLMGKAVRAVWQNPTGAALSGVNLRRVTTITYGLAIASAGAGGVAMSLVYTFDPAAQMGWLIYVFLVVILGGVGSVMGSAAAGLIIGLTVGIAGALFPFAWVNLILFGGLMILLLLKPSGLFQR